MTITHVSRLSTVAEIAEEMDRRGTVIERLEAEIERLTAALSAMNTNVDVGMNEVVSVFVSKY